MVHRFSREIKSPISAGEELVGVSTNEGRRVCGCMCFETVECLKPVILGVQGRNLDLGIGEKLRLCGER